jgi:hypothetical protein
MRTIKESLEVMLENKDLFNKGLCNWAEKLYYRNIITGSEQSKLKNYIDENRPFMLSSISTMCEIIKHTDYYWKEGDIKPRIKWIQKHIKLNS